MVLSGEFGAVFDIGKEIGASAARGFRGEQWAAEDGCKQSGRRV